MATKEQEQADPAVTWGYRKRDIIPHYFVAVSRGPFKGFSYKFYIPEGQENDRDVLEVALRIKALNDRPVNGA